MAQHKKDGKYINLRIDRQICEEFEEYARSKGQTKTIAMERILRSYLNAYKQAQGKEPQISVNIDE